MKDDFAIQEGFIGWYDALEQIISYNNEYILDEFIEDYIEFINKKTAP